jgi:WD40 repeat protein
LDFCTQFKGRVLGDAAANDIPDLKFDEMVKNSNNPDICYFENFHHALRENPRIDLIIKMPGCQILSLKFFSDKKKIIVSLSNGMMLLIDSSTNIVEKTFVSKCAIIDKIKVIDDRYLLCAGIDSKVRIWNIEKQQHVSKFQLHKYCVVHMVSHKEYIYSYGYDKVLMKYNFMSKNKECWIEVQSHISCLKLIKTDDGRIPIKIVASFSDGDVCLYDLDLNVLCHTNR